MWLYHQQCFFHRDISSSLESRWSYRCGYYKNWVWVDREKELGLQTLEVVVDHLCLTLSDWLCATKKNTHIKGPQSMLLSLKASPECSVSLTCAKCRRPASAEKRLLIGKHFAFKLSRWGRCTICSNKVIPDSKRDTKTLNFCPKCDVHLCVGNCFEVFHTRSKC